MRILPPSRLGLGARFFCQQTAAIRYRQLPACCLATQLKICGTHNRQHGLDRHKWWHQPLIKQAVHYSTVSSSKFTSVKTSPRIPVPEQYKNMEFTVFYRLPSIQIMKVLSRLKIYQTCAVVFGVPPLTVLYNAGTVTGETFAGYCAIAGLAGVMLYVMSHYFRRLIGLMSLSECKRIVRVSHLTFWGKRNDLYIPLEDLVPLSDLPDKTTDAYIKMRRYDVDDTLLFTLRWGQILDYDKFSAVFGSIQAR